MQLSKYQYSTDRIVDTISTDPKVRFLFFRVPYSTNLVHETIKNDFFWSVLLAYTMKEVEFSYVYVHNQYSMRGDDLRQRRPRAYE